MNLYSNVLHMTANPRFFSLDMTHKNVQLFLRILYLNDDNEARGDILANMYDSRALSGAENS